MSSNPDLAAEQKYLARANERLQAMRRSAREMMDAALSTPRGGTHQARAERDVIVRQSLARLEQLEIGDQALTFGGIDYDRPLEPASTYHIGRLAVSDEDMEPLVVDWRAPVAEPFYRATGKDPMGLTRRRHFALEHKELIDIEDELFDVEGGPEDQEGAGEVRLSGPGSLFAAVTRARTGRMADIVSTIQAQQDQIIRAPLPGILVVQGGPGTGKTAVALHRAAYLLYTYRMRLERQGVLVIAPSRIFARYIGEVLPSLGESGVQIMTIRGLAGFDDAALPESSEEALLKGDLRMASFVAKAVRDRQRPLKHPAEIALGAFVVAVSPADTAEAVKAAKRRGGTHNRRRRIVESVLAARIVEKYLARKEVRANQLASATGLLDEELASPKDVGVSDETAVKTELARRLTKANDFQRLVQRIWPSLSPEDLVGDLYSHMPLIRLAGRNLFKEEEMRLLFRPMSAGKKVRAWSKSDVVLLNEAKLHLGSHRKRSEDDEERGFGHIIVDEAQDLSPMEARMIGRYSLSSSMTLVGDVAQATSPFGRRSWSEIISAMPKGSSFELVELKVNYRTPQEVMDVAGALLKTFAPELRTAISIRRSGQPVMISHVVNEELMKHLLRVVRTEVQSVEPGTVAVIVPGKEKRFYLDGLAQSGLDVSARPDARLAVLSLDEAKGLEFDSVVISGANHLLSSSSWNLRALFVAMTRTTNRLVFVHNRDVPDVIVDLLSQQKSGTGKEKPNIYYSAHRG